MDQNAEAKTVLMVPYMRRQSLVEQPSVRFKSSVTGYWCSVTVLLGSLVCFPMSGVPCNDINARRKIPFILAILCLHII